MTSDPAPTSPRQEHPLSAPAVTSDPQERRLADTLVDSMPDDVRERYWALRERNVQLQTAIEAGQQQVDTLSSRKNELDAELAASPVRHGDG